MNTANIKKYAPKARARFIDTMMRQAARVGISPDGKGGVVIAPLEQKGDVLVMTAQDGQTHTVPAHLKGAREALAAWVQRDGFTQAIEQAAYSWFNRLCAIRYMEIHGYLDHGRRVLSGAGGEAGQFQILEECLEVDLAGLDTARVRELKLDGTQDETLYRELLLAQCHALHAAMPFLFEPLDDASELLLPNNLTKTDSLIRELVEAIPEADWQDVEVIGWLYQFYISEKKDQVIGKVVKSEDIPAATQLFTPNWIVQYLVQNSVGRQWLQTYPGSPLKAEMPYYIEPAEQEPEVQAQLDAITPASIDPESIKVLDPACGSGHILVEAYNVLKAIYEERGYRTRDIPKLMLENNLFGLDIDDRAAQLAGFALLMKAREDDRRILTRLVDNKVRLNVLAMQSSQHLDANTLWRDLNLTGDWHQGQSQSLFDSEQQDLSNNDATYKLIADLIERFQDAKTFGSLIEVPNSFEAPLKTLLEVLSELSNSGDTMQKTAANLLIPIVRQGWILAQRYNELIANPPFLGRRYQNIVMKNYLDKNHKDASSDLFSSFFFSSLRLAKRSGHVTFVTPFVWLYLPTYEKFRKKIYSLGSIASLIQLEAYAYAFAEVGLCAFSFQKGLSSSFCGDYVRLSGFRGRNIQSGLALEAIKSTKSEYRYKFSIEEARKIPRAPLIYWMNQNVLGSFIGNSIKDVADSKTGLQTGDNDQFVRLWHEVSFDEIGFLYENSKLAEESNRKWFPSTKSGGYCKWYGKNHYVVNWQKDGREIKEKKHFEYKSGKASISQSKCWNERFYFKNSIGWPLVGYFSVKLNDTGSIFDINTPCVFSERDKLLGIMGLLNSKVGAYFVEMFSPTVNTSPGVISDIPLVSGYEHINKEVERAVQLSKELWDKNEISWGFSCNGLTSGKNRRLKISAEEKVAEIIRIENEINLLEREIDDYFIRLYSFEDLANEDAPFLRNSSSDKDIANVVECLISYTVGCFMGRYSLDKTGLILCSQGETVRDYLAQIPNPSFSPDENAIIPLTDQEWFPDDATNRFRDFVRTLWGEELLQENLDFVAESLCLQAIKLKKGEAALDTIRRYLSTQFYKDHLRTYKKRPIYWLFSSGKQKAFECLVYLHRYNESTLAEMRTDYVIPLTTKLASYVEKLEQDKDTSTSAAEAKAIEKELSKLYKQQAELNTFDEKLRHYADQRISLDLDDGVKLNYGKFGDLLAEVKQVVGK